MSEQLAERHIGSTPDTLTESEIKKLREDLEALFSCARDGRSKTRTPVEAVGLGALGVVLPYAQERMLRPLQEGQITWVERLVERLGPGSKVGVYTGRETHYLTLDTPPSITVGSDGVIRLRLTSEYMPHGVVAAPDDITPIE